MHCSHCGEQLSNNASTCTRCGADLSADARLHSLLVTISFAAISLVVVSIIIFFVLFWHESQIGIVSLPN